MIHQTKPRDSRAARPGVHPPASPAIMALLPVRARAIEPNVALWQAFHDPNISADEFAAIAHQIYGDDDE
jgi:hypothetical protein